jgi:hypothetical protein
MYQGSAIGSGGAPGFRVSLFVADAIFMELIAQKWAQVVRKWAQVRMRYNPC